jgi:hypothetical protein
VTCSATTTAAVGHLRRLAPQIVCVGVVPALLSTICMRTAGLTATAVTMLAWTVTASWWHRQRHGVVPGLFVLKLAGDVIKVAVALVTGSTTVYFLQPSATTMAIALTCVGSVLVGRPLGARVARDFLPPTALEGRTDSATFDRITLWWAASRALSAMAGAFVFTRVPLETFLVVRPFVGWSCTGIGAAGVAWLWGRSSTPAVPTPLPASPAPVVALPLPLPLALAA